MEISFSTDNAAFQDGNESSEIIRILREISEKIDHGIDGGLVRDINGNQIGSWG